MLKKPLQGALSPCCVPVLGCSGLEHGCDAPVVGLDVQDPPSGDLVLLADHQ